MKVSSWSLSVEAGVVEVEKEVMRFVRVVRASVRKSGGARSEGEMGWAEVWREARWSRVQVLKARRAVSASGERVARRAEVGESRELKMEV